MKCQAKVFSSGPTIHCDAEADCECIDQWPRSGFRVYYCQRHVTELDGTWSRWLKYDPASGVDFYDGGTFGSPRHYRRLPVGEEAATL